MPPDIINFQGSATPRRRRPAVATNVRAKLFNPQVRPHWIGDTDTFWYRHESADGVKIMLVDAATGAQTPANFDPQVAKVAAPGESLSPDGSRAVFCRAHDLWLRDNGAERRLTFDGAPHFAYGVSGEMNLTHVSLQRRGIVLPANALFSPDGSKIFTSRVDERLVADLPLVQHVPDDGSVRPIVHHMRFALSGDKHLPVETHCIIDLNSGTLTQCPAGPHVTGMTTCIEKEEAWWSADGVTAHPTPANGYPVNAFRVASSTDRPVSFAVLPMDRKAA